MLNKISNHNNWLTLLILLSGWCGAERPKTTVADNGAKEITLASSSYILFNYYNSDYS